MGDTRGECVIESVIADAFVLSGGGAYGAYEVGVMKALCSGRSPASGYQPVNPDLLSGTSVGAFNAAFMTMYPELSGSEKAANLEKTWLHEVCGVSGTRDNGVIRFRANPFQYLDQFPPTSLSTIFLEPARDAAFLAQYWFSRLPGVLCGPGRLSQRLVQLVDISAFVSVDPFQRLIAKTLQLEEIRNSEALLRIAATNFETGAVQVFANEDMTDECGARLIMASAAIPGIFPPVEAGSATYVDGGVVMNTPLKNAIEGGATTLHVVYLDPDVRNVPLYSAMNTLDTFDRVYTIMLATKINEDIATASWINDGLKTVERAEKGELTDFDARAFVRVAGKVAESLKAGKPYKPLTIHRYHPRDELGGLLGMLNFNQQAVIKFIERGFSDAVAHDCKTSDCILPD
jgi:predicted acylesterase/phospholipase RssA